MENTETRVWLDFALAYGYLDNSTKQDFDSRSEEIERSLNHMILNPKKYLRKPE